LLKQTKLWEEKYNNDVIKYKEGKEKDEKDIETKKKMVDELSRIKEEQEKHLDILLKRVGVLEQTLERREEDLAGCKETLRKKDTDMV
jgi:pyrroloquinoline quinone (PQQ) biosynthesis protein C